MTSIKNYSDEPKDPIVPRIMAICGTPASGKTKKLISMFVQSESSRLLVYDFSKNLTLRVINNIEGACSSYGVVDCIRDKISNIDTCIGIKSLEQFEYYISKLDVDNLYLDDVESFIYGLKDEFTLDRYILFKKLFHFLFNMAQTYNKKIIATININRDSSDSKLILCPHFVYRFCDKIIHVDGTKITTIKDIR